MSVSLKRKTQGYPCLSSSLMKCNMKDFKLHKRTVFNIVCGGGFCQDGLVLVWGIGGGLKV